MDYYLIRNQDFSEIISKYRSNKFLSYQNCQLNMVIWRISRFEWTRCKKWKNCKKVWYFCTILVFASFQPFKMHYCNNSSMKKITQGTIFPTFNLLFFETLFFVPISSLLVPFWNYANSWLCLVWNLFPTMTFVMGHPVMSTIQCKEQLNKNTLKTTIIWSWFDTETREVFIVLTSTHLIYEFSSKMDASLKFIHRPPSYFGTSIELATPTIMTSDYYFIVGGLTRRPTSNG